VAPPPSLRRLIILTGFLMFVVSFFLGAGFTCCFVWAFMIRSFSVKHQRLSNQNNTFTSVRQTQVPCSGARMLPQIQCPGQYTDDGLMVNQLVTQCESCLVSRAGSTGRCNTAQCFDSRMLAQAEPIYLAVLDQNQAWVVFRRPYLSQRFWPLFSLQIGFEFSVASTH
jgi:hypothetical protein